MTDSKIPQYQIDEILDRQHKQQLELLEIRNIAQQKEYIRVYIKSAPQQDGSQLPARFEDHELHICESCKVKYIRDFPLTGYSSGGVLDLGFKSKSEIKNEV